MLLARLMGLSGAATRVRCAELMPACDLEAAATRQVRRYSGGMRRRLNIAAAMIARPELLFLDEPITGLGQRARAAPAGRDGGLRMARDPEDPS